MDKTPIKNKAVLDILEDAKDGVLKDENKKKVNELLSEQPMNDGKVEKFLFNGKYYDTIRDLPTNYDQARRWVELGKVKRVKVSK